MHVIIIFLSQFQKKVEEGYKFAVYRTRACPRNKTEWEKRESAFNCSKESSSYTCLPNENITELLEFCYPQQVLASHEGKNMKIMFPGYFAFNLLHVHDIFFFLQFFDFFQL